MSYIDVNGKVGNTDLRGESGKLYNEARLVNDQVLSDDGIDAYNPPTANELSDEDKEIVREAAIRSDAWEVAAETIYGEPKPGSTTPQVSAAENVLAIADLGQALLDTGMLVDLPESVVKAIADAAILRDLEQLANDAIDSGLTQEEVRKNIDKKPWRRTGGWDRNWAGNDRRRERE